MPFPRRSPRNRATPIEAVTNPEPRRESFMSRFLQPSSVVRQSRETTKHHRREQIGPRTSRGPFRSRKAQPVTDAITPTHQRRPSLGDKIQGFGKRLARSLSGRPAQQSTGARVVTGTRRRNRFL